MGKRDAAIYGRTIYLYLTRNDKGVYRSLLNLIDPKDFLIDPDVGGLCTEEEDGSGVEKQHTLDGGIPSSPGLNFSKELKMEFIIKKLLMNCSKVEQ
jgi:hypothetical protein